MPDPRMHWTENPALDGLSDLHKMQVSHRIQTRQMIELVNQAGGEVILPSGFQERLRDDSESIETHFLEDGSYRIRVVETPAEFRDGGQS